MKRGKTIIAVLLCVSLMFSVACRTENSILQKTEYIPVETNPTPDKSLDKSRSPDIGSNYNLIADNGILQLYLDTTSAFICVRDIATGNTWYSNPPDWQEDKVAAGINKEYMRSQLRIYYMNSSSLEQQMNSYSDCMVNEQVEYGYFDGGCKITYTIGDPAYKFIYPQICTQERFEEYINQLSDSDRKSVLRRYTLFETATAKREELELYPTLSETNIYVARDTINTLIAETLHELFGELGYTLEDMLEDIEVNGLELDDSRVSFSVPVVYKLDGNTLSASIPTQEIVYQDAFPLTKLIFLEYFGSAGFDDEGYIFVPDGTGSIINLNNGKFAETQYIDKVYGRDYTFSLESQMSYPYPINMPVFGLKANDKSFFTIIDDGEAFAAIYARVSNLINSYNSVYTQFTPLPSENLVLDSIGNNQLQVYQPEMYSGSFSLKFFFLTGEGSDYNAMANVYRNELIKSGAITKQDDGKNVPFVLETITAFNKKKNVLGIPYEGMETATSFAQTTELINMLLDSGVSNLAVRTTGWMNGGLEQDSAFKMNVLSEVGGKNELVKLNEFLNNLNIPFYPDVCFTYAYKETMSGGFSISSDAARSLENKVVRKSKFNIVLGINTVYEGSSPIITSPVTYQKQADVIASSLQDLGINGISLQSFYSDLNSSFKSGEETDRQQALNAIKKVSDSLEESGFSQLANSPNFYGLFGVDYAIDLPLTSNRYLVTDANIPFMQMVLRGYVHYTGSAFNEMIDSEEAFLRALETGSGLYCKWMYADNDIIQDTHFTHLYSHNYKLSYDSAVKTYNELASVLNSVVNVEIERYDIITDNVRMTTYENGVKIVVNHSDMPFDYMGKTVNANSYLVI